MFWSIVLKEIFSHYFTSSQTQGKKKKREEKKENKSKIYAWVIVVSSVGAMDTWLAIEQGYSGI